MAQINSCLSGKKLFTTWLCKAGLHSHPLKWRESCLEILPLRKRSNMGNINKPEFTQRSETWLTPLSAHRHLRISLPFNLRWCCGSVIACSYQRLKVRFDDTHKWSKSRAANENIHINAPDNAYVYGQAEEGDETGARFLELSVSWIKALTQSLALNQQTHTYIFIIYIYIVLEKKENSCVLLPPVTSKHLWLLAEATTARRGAVQLYVGPESRPPPW